MITIFIWINSIINTVTPYLDNLYNNNIINKTPKIPTPVKDVAYDINPVTLKTDYNIVNLYKIGKTKKFKERIRTHNSSHIHNVDIVHIYETDYIDEVEKCLKNVLSSKQYKKRKEFYEIDIDILKELIKICDKMSLKVRKNNKNIKQTGGYYIMLDLLI